MEGECKVLLDAAVHIETEKQATQSMKPSSKLTTALVAFTLCLAAAAAVAAVFVFSRHTKGPGQDEYSFDMHHTLRQIQNVRAAIHLEGEYNEDRTDSVEWKNNVDQSHSQGDLAFDNNEILIGQDGLYFVYSQVSFRVSCSSSDADDSSSDSMVHLSHNVQRWSSSYGNDDRVKKYQTILHSVRTACQRTTSSDSDESWYSAVYMGAVFNLNRGDRLRTVMEEKMLENLEDGPGKNFFGVFAL